MSSVEQTIQTIIDVFMYVCSSFSKLYIVYVLTVLHAPTQKFERPNGKHKIQNFFEIGPEFVPPHTSLDRRKDTRPVKFLQSFKALMDFRTQ